MRVVEGVMSMLFILGLAVVFLLLLEAFGVVLGRVRPGWIGLAIWAVLALLPIG